MASARVSLTRREIYLIRVALSCLEATGLPGDPSRPEESTTMDILRLRNKLGRLQEQM